MDSESDTSYDTPTPASTLVGWKEWVELPELGLPALEVKVDTGARTSALHAFCLETFADGDQLWARFGVHPVRGRIDIEVFCQAPIVDQRIVSDSGGHQETRPVILTPIRLGGQVWPIEITLTNRDTMKFRMLLGRTAMRNRLVVDPSSAFLQPQLSYDVYCQPNSFERTPL